MIIWKGMGILSLILPVGLALLCEWIFKTKTAEFIAVIVGGVLVFFIGLGTIMRSEEEKAAGVKSKLFHHTFFFLPMFLWGLFAIGYGIYRLL